MPTFVVDYTMPLTQKGFLQSAELHRCSKSIFEATCKGIPTEKNVIEQRCVDAVHRKQEVFGKLLRYRAIAHQPLWHFIRLLKGM